MGDMAPLLIGEPVNGERRASVLMIVFASRRRLLHLLVLLRTVQLQAPILPAGLSQHYRLRPDKWRKK